MHKVLADQLGSSLFPTEPKNLNGMSGDRKYNILFSIDSGLFSPK